jgi:hypothetical protein
MTQTGDTMKTTTKAKAKTASLKLLRNSKPSSNDSSESEIHSVQMFLVRLIGRENEKAQLLKELSDNCTTHAQHASRALTAFTRLVKKGVFLLLIAAALAAPAQAEPRQRQHQRQSEPNYILRRQEAGLVSGMPTTRRIIGKREIDGYHDYRTGTTLWFEGDHVVGVTH